MAKKIEKVWRKGKWLIIDMKDRPESLVFHLGMSGSVVIEGTKPLEYMSFIAHAGNIWPPSHSRLLIDFEGAPSVAFIDVRRFGKMYIQKDPISRQPLKSLGPDPFNDDISEEAFAERMTKVSKKVKSALLDQSIFCGIGNWLADDILLEARIHPEMQTKLLTRNQFNRLRLAIFEIINSAVQYKAKCSSFPSHWLFHFRWKKLPGPSLGYRIHYLNISGRTTAFIPQLQGKKLESQPRSEGVLEVVTPPKKRRKGIN